MHAREQGKAAVALARIGRRALAAALLLAAALAPAAWGRDPITPLSDVHRGLHCTARTVVQGTAIATFDVDVLDVIAGVGDLAPRILVRVSGPAVAGTGIAEGFSGSPVYCPDAHGRIGNAGAISATVGQYGEDVGLVTPIEQMLGVGLPPTRASGHGGTVHGMVHAPRLLRSARPLVSPLVISGLSPSLGDLVERAARHSGRTIVAAPAGPLGSFPPQPLVPGASLAVTLSKGAVAAGAIGTVTYRDGSTIYGFGHPFEGAGPRALLLGDAYVFTVVNNPLDLLDIAVSYKLAAPGHVLGTLTDDAPAGVLGSVGAAPPIVPLTVTVRDGDTGRNVQQRTDVVDEVDLGDPSGDSAMSLIAPLAIAQAVTTAFDGSPARESGRMCLRARVRETSTPLRFCNRYVLDGEAGAEMPPLISLLMGDDATRALSAISHAHFAALHLTRISIGVKVSRGLRLASIVGMRAPRRVRPGKQARIALRVRLERGPLRTIHLKLRVPRDLPGGPQPLVLAGTAPDIDSGDGGFFGFFFSFFGDESQPGSAQSLPALTRNIAHLGRYDGVRALFGRHRPSLHAYLDPNVRIAGHAITLVKVIGPKHPRGGHDHGPPGLDVNQIR